MGSFSNDDRNGNKNVMSKHNFVLLQSLRDYSKLFNKTKVWQSLRNEIVMREKMRIFSNCRRPP